MAKPETEAPKLEPKSEVEEVGPCKIRLHVEIDAQKVKDRITEKYRDLNNSVALPGFRKGKAPRSLMERKFGKAILDDVKGELLSLSFDEVKEDRKLEPLGEPDIDMEKLSVTEGEPFSYDMIIEIKPTFDLKGYTGLKVERPAVVISDEDVDRVLEGFRQSKAELEAAPDGAKLEDQLISDVVFRADEQEIDKTENNTILLSEDISFHGLPLKDFHKAFLGKRPGETVRYELDVPEDFRVKEAAGKKGVLEVKIKSVKRRKLPEIDENFAKSFDMDSVEEMREEISRRVKREKEASARAHMMDHLVDQILQANEFALPEGVVQSSTEEMLQRMRLQMTMQGVPAEEVEKQIETQKTESKDSMVKSLRAHFVMEEIAKKERIFVTEDQVEERIAQLAAQQGHWPHEMKAHLEERGLLTQLRRQMREEAVRTFLLDKAEIVETPPEKQEGKVEST